MTRGTTPTITLTLNEVDLTSLKSVYNISKVVSKISRPAKGRLLYYSILGGNFG